MFLPNKEPSPPGIMCCSITNAILKGVDTGVLSLNEVRYRPGKFLLASLLLKEKMLLKMETDITAISFYREKQEGN